MTEYDVMAQAIRRIGTVMHAPPAESDTTKASVEAKAVLAFLIQWADGRTATPVSLPGGEVSSTAMAALVLPVHGFTADPAGLVVPTLRVRVGVRGIAGRGLFVTRRVDGGKVVVVRVEIR